MFKLHLGDTANTLTEQVKRKYDGCRLAHKESFTDRFGYLYSLVTNGKAPNNNMRSQILAHQMEDNKLSFAAFSIGKGRIQITNTV